MVKLCLDDFIVFSKQCAFRKRYYEDSGGYAISIKDLARGIREFLHCLASDPMILEYAASHPGEWNELHRYLMDSKWRTYRFRWGSMYRNRMPPLQWAMAGFALPPKYYRVVGSKLTRALIAAMIMAPVRKFFPQAYETYQVVKTRFRKAT